MDSPGSALGSSVSHLYSSFCMCFADEDNEKEENHGMGTGTFHSALRFKRHIPEHFLVLTLTATLSYGQERCHCPSYFGSGWLAQGGTRVKGQTGPTPGCLILSSARSSHYLL